MKKKPSGPQRIAYRLVIILPALFTGAALLSWILGIEIADPVLDGLRIEAIGALLTAGFVVLLDRAFQGFLDTEDQDEQPATGDIKAELKAIRQELHELKQLLAEKKP
ncbi:MAG: hypothetical protein JXN59_07750 [Anaerolineae bacterium]|nr:hypothetical protein [Anaerolineae bacterium]